MTLNPRCEHVETAQGVPLTVTGVAQVKVMTEKGLLAAACEQFLGKQTKHIQEVIQQTLDGHLRAILGTMTVEAVYQDRDKFAALVREVAAPDLGRMGMEILSFTIKDVMDSVQYLDSLGKAQTANVKRDAEIGVAEANRDAGIKVRVLVVINVISDNVLFRKPSANERLRTCVLKWTRKSPTRNESTKCNRRLSTWRSIRR